ncbi:MAG TPA: hypothetical protein PLX23_02630 [Candidatus Hydrogenedens sp.]|nr:hypothetical protein [Candidatus Hydrogenedens sp.]
MGKTCITRIQNLILISLICCVLNCSKNVDTATTITLAKSKINEYHQIQEQMKSLQQSPNQQNQLQELRIRSQSLINDVRTMLEQINILSLNYPEGISTYLDALELQGNYDLAVEALENLVRKDPTSGDLWVRLGLDNMKKGRNWIETAYRCFEKAAKLKISDNQKLKMWRALGDIYWELRQIEPAKEAYSKALDISSDVWSKVGLAGIDVVYGDMKEAENKLTSLGKGLQEYDVSVRLRMREALALFEQLNKNIDTSSEMFMVYSHILYRAGRIEDAIATANHALFLNASNWEGWNFLGSVNLQFGYLKDVEHAFSESLKYNSEQPSIKQVLEEIAQAKNKTTNNTKNSQPLIFKKD